MTIKYIGDFKELKRFGFKKVEIKLKMYNQKVFRGYKFEKTAVDFIYITFDKECIVCSDNNIEINSKFVDLIQANLIKVEE